jgi:23S rRNA-/tRNA-specific pseudouridylate synthase
MGRPKIDVDETVLRNTIADSEAEQTFSSLNALYDFVADVLDVSKSVVMLRIKELGIQVKTQPGKRGRPPAATKETSEAKSKPTEAKTAAPAGNEIWDAIVLCFEDRGISVEKPSDLLTLRGNTQKQNKDVNLAWNDFRDMYDCPGPKRNDPNHPTFKAAVNG